MCTTPEGTAAPKAFESVTYHIAMIYLHSRVLHSLRCHYVCINWTNLLLLCNNLLNVLILLCKIYMSSYIIMKGLTM